MMTLNPEFLALTFHAEMSNAAVYAERNPKLAMECALVAHGAAIGLHNPRMAAEANDLMCAIRR